MRGFQLVIEIRWLLGQGIHSAGFTVGFIEKRGFPVGYKRAYYQ